MALVFRRNTIDEVWWGRSGTVDVQIIDGKRVFAFVDMLVFLDSDHTKTSNASGLLPCPPGAKPAP